MYINSYAETFAGEGAIMSEYDAFSWLQDSKVTEAEIKVYNFNDWGSLQVFVPVGADAQNKKHFLYKIKMTLKAEETSTDESEIIKKCYEVLNQVIDHCNQLNITGLHKDFLVDTGVDEYTSMIRKLMRPALQFPHRMKSLEENIVNGEEHKPIVPKNTDTNQEFIAL